MKTEQFLAYCGERKKKPGGFGPNQVWFYDPVLKVREVMHSDMIQMLKKLFTWRSGPRRITLLYDIPNIEKRLVKYRLQFGVLTRRHLKMVSRNDVAEADDVIWDISFQDFIRQFV